MIYPLFHLSLSSCQIYPNVPFLHTVGMDNHTFNKNIAAHSYKNRSVFLQKCIEEKIIPKCTMKSYKLSQPIFPHHVQEYLEVSKTLRHHQATVLFQEASQLSLELHKHHNFTDRISQNTSWMIENFNHIHYHKLSNKLTHLLDESKWKHIGSPEMVLNLTDFKFSTTEMEALSLGLKFATGIHKNITTNTILSNYNTDFFKGFIQEIILASVSQPNNSSLPKRYIKALSNLTQNPNIIFPTDKSSGVEIKHK